MSASTTYCGLPFYFQNQLRSKNITFGLGQKRKMLRFDRKLDGPFSKPRQIIPGYVRREVSAVVLSIRPQQCTDQNC